MILYKEEDCFDHGESIWNCDFHIIERYDGCLILVHKDKLKEKTDESNSNC